MVLGDVEETVYVVEDDDGEGETVRVCRIAFASWCIQELIRSQTVHKKSEMLFVRGMPIHLPFYLQRELYPKQKLTIPSTGDSVVLISPQTSP